MDDRLPGPAELQRPKSNLIEHRRVEKLDIGILKHQLHAAPEIEGERIIVETAGVEPIPLENHAAGFRKV